MSFFSKVFNTAAENLVKPSCSLAQLTGYPYFKHQLEVALLPTTKE
ncbi:hypothetical protein RNAN_1429 [Rheinheimera nanhaiensis E407-8]|uniref:Uncharacterized protein n=1 Tax=Rheinheimera nanhaiensis E407-8 TaxID=562729 RepID=I1DWM9_9GAMM|nr:hypothetical protein RNAN_1429 [Rheinheimera nanhaiensis E407-8]